MKKIFNSFYDKNSLLYVFEETKLDSIQICLMFYILLCKIIQISKNKQFFKL